MQQGRRTLAGNTATLLGEPSQNALITQTRVARSFGRTQVASASKDASSHRRVQQRGYHDQNRRTAKHPGTTLAKRDASTPLPQGKSGTRRRCRAIQWAARYGINWTETCYRRTRAPAEHHRDCGPYKHHKNRKE